LRFPNEWCIIHSIEKAFKEGDGMHMAFYDSNVVKAVQTEKQKIAQTMLRDGLPFSLISKYTDLDISELEKINNEESRKIKKEDLY